MFVKKQQIFGLSDLQQLSAAKNDGKKGNMYDF